MTGTTDRRGESLALAGCVLGFACAVILGVLAIWSGSKVVWVACFQVTGVIGVWFLCLLQLHQLRLVAEEHLEVDELERQRQQKLGGVQTIFEEEDLDQMDKLAMGRRLRSMERLLLPALAMIVATYHIAAGIAVLPWLWDFPPLLDALTLIERAPVSIFVLLGMGFAFFMGSRYAIGMSRLYDWSALRAGGNYMFGSSMVCFAALIALGFTNQTEKMVVEGWITNAIAALLLVLAVETVINFVLDFYRPRIEGAFQRPFYDSRLLGMFSEPGGILRSLANAIDYQFGFKVSETWFYKLLGRAIPMLLLLQLAVVLGLSTIVVVPPGHRAVIEHLGIGEAEAYTAGAGVHLTWPWPIDRADVIPVERIRRLEIGHERNEEDPPDFWGVPILWTRKHYTKEYKILVGDRNAAEHSEGDTPVNLLSLSMPIHWRVRGDDAAVLRFHRETQNPAEIVESLAYRELTRYAAGADILDLLGAGGVKTARVLKENVQAACDRAGRDGKGLGIEIVHIGVHGIHPPPDDDVALAYENVVNAFEKRDTKIKKAEGDAAKLRVAAAGDAWEALYDAILAEDAARAESSDDLAAKTAVVETMLRSVSGGEARKLCAAASQETYDRVFSELAAAERYRVQSETYRTAPGTYMLHAYLRMLEEGLAHVRKFIIAVDEPDKVLYVADLKPPQTLDILGAEIAALEAGSDDN